jgi:hypothetical protein
VAENGAQVGSSFWLGYWSDNVNSGTPTHFFVGIFAGLNLTVAMMVLIRSLIMNYSCRRAGVKLHNIILDKGLLFKKCTLTLCSGAFANVVL